MSTFSSLCHDEQHNDQLDIAYSFVEDNVRLILRRGDSDLITEIYLELDEAKHTVDLIQQAIGKIEKELNDSQAN